MYRCTLREAVELAEEGAEHPALRQTVDQVHPGTEARHHQVGHGEVDDVEVGRGLQLLVPPHDARDETVTDQRHDDDDRVDADLEAHLQTMDTHTLITNH